MTFTDACFQAETLTLEGCNICYISLLRCEACQFKNWVRHCNGFFKQLDFFESSDRTINDKLVGEDTDCQQLLVHDLVVHDSSQFF